MEIYRYDSTFEGLLTCVFDAFNRKELPVRIQLLWEPVPLFFDSLDVITDTDKASRVLAGLKKKLSASAIQMLFVCFLSEKEGVEIILFNYIVKAFASTSGSIELNFADDDVLELSKIYKKVNREAEHVQQFLRFQKTADNIFFAYIEPPCNVLPLVADFFEDRFADQQWIIYDAKREYGLYYNKEKTEEVRFDSLAVAPGTGKLASHQLDVDEVCFQTLWKDYLKAITIRERVNLRLQRQHMPRRFWKLLTEKQ